MKTTSAKLPLTLRLALSALNKLFPVFHAGRTRDIRPERFSAIQTVLAIILRHCDLSRSAAVMRRVPCGKTTLVLPCSVPVIATEAGLGQRRVERCLHDLVTAGLLQSPKQIRRPVGPNVWQVFTVRRSLTAKFWDILGLTKQYLHDAGYCAVHTFDAAMREVQGFCRRCSDGHYRQCAAPADRSQYDADPPPTPLKEQIRQLTAMAERNQDLAGAAIIREKYSDAWR